MKDFISDEEEKFYELGEDTVDLFKSILEEKSIPFKLKIAYIGSVKLKKLIEIKKISDIHSYLLNGKEIMVVINEDLLARMDDEAINIQFEEAINGIEVNLSNGKIKITKPKFSVSLPLVKKHGFEKILRAHNLESEVQSQKKDMEATA